MDNRRESSTVQTVSAAHESSSHKRPESEATTMSRTANHNYPFLVHSTDSVANNRPPNVDNKPLARQKRRRTSPEDQKILEDAYVKNPKPDKAARIDIVSRVALGEKEVQIWFQNRRQSSRRKAKPLEPHEIAQYQSTNSSPLGPPSTERQSGSFNAISIDEASADQEDVDPNTEADDPSQDNTIPSASQNASGSFIQIPSSQPLPSSQDSASKAGYLSNRRNNASFRSFASESQPEPEPEPEPDSPEDQEPPVKRLKKSESKIRLSMTADGVARVMEGNDMSSSPPRQTAPPPATPGTAPRTADENGQRSNELKRTQSLISLTDTPGSQDSGTGLRRKPSGRSRDSRVWSFFADRGGRSELEERAQQEASGDAAEAISILRQQEKERARHPIMRTSSFKRPNPQPSSEDRAVKRLRASQSFTAPSPSIPSATAATPFRQPLLQRSASARNTQSSNRRPQHDPLMTKTPKLKQTPTFEIPATDSDKENWSPGDRPSAFADRHFMHQMQTSPAVMPSTVRRPRGSYAPSSFHETPAPRGRGRHANRAQTEEVDDDEDDDEEVMRFMGQTPGSSLKEKRAATEREERQSSEEEDFDCVQGLLKLSQGNWGGGR